MLHSIRWRLPLSYGAIALVAILALGAILLVTLNNYYERQEAGYLQRNAEVIGEVVASAGFAPERNSFVQSQITTLAFLTQTRIRVFDEQGILMADSGNPTEQQAVATISLLVEDEHVSQQFSQTFAGESDENQYQSVIVIDDGTQSMRTETSITGSQTSLFDEFANPLANLVTPFSIDEGISAQRSEQIVTYPLLDLAQVRERGYIELSQGPAYGESVLRSVTWALVLAGGVAVLVATGVGVWMSGKIGRPILNLAETTVAMANGDLSVRSGVEGKGEIGRLAHSFNQMAERVETTVTTLRRFAADAAHELNTPLTALQTNLELAADQPDNPYFLHQAQTQTQRLAILTDDLLQLSRLEAQPNVVVWQEIDWTQLIANRSELFAARADQVGISFQLQLPDVPVFVCGDRAQLQRVYDNLLDNAVKFTPKGGSVSVQLTTIDSMAHLTVCDTGIGIGGDVGLIFGRFHRAPNAAGFAGSGLGLAIAHNILAQHKGGISAENTDDGTKLVVKLPLVSREVSKSGGQQLNLKY